ncbi:DUF3592 domain-containing protein [Sinorhizobium americanum]|uniref:DUF3592 domain-containing protein n=1 Tax=Sinorhizobium americanum TaxID=194963 RepID=UPI0007D994CB|nr:DUF3592 domain-containing protein [Sinorhizobium americanum]OAP39232.1 hypothetical protein ATC00_07195 [Sinorhizobium americanum]
MDLNAAFSTLYAWFAEDLRLVRLLLLAVGVWLALDIAWKLRRDALLRRTGTSTEGQIVRVSRGEDYDTAIIRFTDQTGRTHEFDSELPHSGPPGASINIRYDPQNPRRAHVAGGPLGRTLLYVVTLMTAAGSVFLSVVMGS